MGSRSSNIVFLVGFIVYVTIRGVFERRARIKEKMVRRLDAVEKTLLIFVGVGSLLLRQTILDGSTQFAKGGGKLIKLEFPKTEIQMYGLTAIIYSSYSYELEQGGQRSTHSGRIAEVFVNRKGQWVNPGWHMDNEK